MELYSNSIIKTDQLSGPFVAELPEVYQVEVSSICNYDCQMCARKQFSRRDAVNFLPISTLQKMVREGAFKGSYFVELQMSGEPLLYPYLHRATMLLKSAGVRVGLSTNGSLLRKKAVALSLLDYVTFSVDSLTNYSGIRQNKKGVTSWSVLDDIKWYIDGYAHYNGQAIDLQVIELPGWENELELLRKEMEGFPVNIRTVKDCFLTVFNQADRYPVSYSPCVNIWMSVSVQSNGNVVPCCFSWWDDIIYGNINEQSLEEIWNGPAVARLREQHATQNYPDICARCYGRSPALLHWNIFTKSMR